MIKKGFVLVIIFVILIVISFVAFAAINLMRQQAHLTEHSIGRTRGLLAAQAAMVHAYENLRKQIPPYNTLPVINDTISVGSAPHAITVRIYVLTPGASQTTPEGDIIHCPPTAPSDSCIHAYIPD